MVSIKKKKTKQTWLLQDAASLKQAEGKLRFLHSLTRGASCWALTTSPNHRDWPWQQEILRGIWLSCAGVHTLRDHRRNPFHRVCSLEMTKDVAKRQITQAECYSQGHVVGEMQRSQVS